MIRLALLAALAVPLAAHADPKPPAKPVVTSSPAALQVLTAVEANYKQPQHLSVAFEQTVTNVISGQASPSLGTFLVEKPDKLKFVFMQPKKANPKPKATYLFDGKTVWVIDHPNMKFGRKAAANSELPSLVAFFLGAGTLSRDFTVTLASTGALELTPKTPSAAYAKIILVVDATKHVTQTSIIDSSGNTQTMKFTSVVVDKPAPAGTFAFDRKQFSVYEELKN
jgi:outer membrane lipoprotein-sorting protein